MTPLSRWNDDRLDDLYEDLRRTMNTVDEIGALKTDLSYVAKDVTSCRNNIHKLRDDIAATALRQANERRSDKRWYIGTFIASISMLSGGIAIILGHTT